MGDLNNNIKQFDINNIYRTLPQMIEEYTLFLSVHRTITKGDHILGYIIFYFRNAH